MKRESQKNFPPNDTCDAKHFFDDMFLRTKLVERDAHTETEIKFIMKYADGFADCAVLDVGCSAGRIALPLAKEGLSVTGIDINPAYIALARQKAKQEKVSCAFLVADDRTFKEEISYNIVISIFSTFGYHSDEENTATISNISQSLKTGGILIMEIHNRLHYCNGEKKVDVEGGITVEKQHVYDEEHKRINMKWKYSINGNLLKTANLSMKLFSLEEVIEILGEHGLSVAEVFSDMRFSPFSSSSRKIVLVAQKVS